MLQVMAETVLDQVARKNGEGGPEGDVSADKTSVVSADKTSVVSADRTSVASADTTSVVSQDITPPHSPQRGGREAAAPLWRIFGDVLGDHRCLVC